VRKAWQIIERVVGALALLAVLIQTGRILERLDRVEGIASDYMQTIKMQGTVTQGQYQELRDIHVRAGDL
jgi:hypothetical protein